MKTVLKRLAVLVSILLFVGCASTGVNFDEHKMIDIKKGETTEGELVQMFGAPQNRMVNSEGIVTLTWTYAEASVKGESFIPFAGAFVGGGKTKGKTLSVRLQNDKVTDYTFSDGGSETRNMTEGAVELKLFTSCFQKPHKNQSFLARPRLPDITDFHSRRNKIGLDRK